MDVTADAGFLCDKPVALEEKRGNTLYKNTLYNFHFTTLV
jgi:hypothetical protein